MLIWNTATLAEIIKTISCLKKNSISTKALQKKNVEAGASKRAKIKIIGAQLEVLFSTNTVIILALCLDSPRQNME